MRILHAAALAIAAVSLASATSAQGLGDAAAREKEKRKASSTGKPKVITESDLGRPMGPGTLSSPGTAEEGSTPATPGTGDEKAAAPAAGGPDTPEGGAAAPADTKSAEEERAKAEAAWRKKLDMARKEEQVYQDMINRLQLELNDMSGGVYNPGRAARMAFLDENKQKLVEVQQRIATLEAEGRSNAYR